MILSPYNMLSFLALSCTVKKLSTQACMDYRATGDSMTSIIAMLPKKQPNITSMLGLTDHNPSNSMSQHSILRLSCDVGR